MDEFQIIDTIKNRIKTPSDLVAGIGDDCAVIPPQGASLVTTDMLMDGVHFNCGQDPWELIGRKVLAVNISDIAAMGGYPTYAFLSLALPKGIEESHLTSFMDGFLALAKEFQIVLAGGDTNVWQKDFAVSVCLHGRPFGKNICYRSGAKVGDFIFVTGPLGGSLESKRHLHFTPRVREARYLAERHRVNSMIDISDGLVSDLGHICAQSGVGYELQLDTLPINTNLSMLRPEERIQKALTDGEDFELCFTTDPDSAKALIEDNARGFPVWLVGEIKSSQFYLGHFEGNRMDLTGYFGFKHSI